MDASLFKAIAMLAGVAGLLSPARAAERLDSITWLTSAALHSDARAQNDGLIEFLDQALALPGPNRVVQANAKRSWQLIGAGEKVCHVALLQTRERLRTAYFSLTAMSLPPHLVVPRGARRSLPLTTAGEVDLPRLLAKPGLIGAVVEGRSYGAVIDAMLAARPRGTEAIHAYSAADYGSTMPSMLARGRAQYAIEHPKALEQMAGLSPEVAALEAIPIAGAAAPVFSGVACPRNPWGRAAITAIERALASPPGITLIHRQVDAAMSADEQRRHAAALQQLLQRRGKPGQAAASP